MEDEKVYNLLKAAYHEVIKSPSGRDVLWHILSECGLYHDTFTGDNNTFYLEGKRAVGLSILTIMEDVDKTSYARLLLEKAKENTDD